MLTIVFIPTHGFSWNDTCLLQYIDSRLTQHKYHKDRLSIFAPAWFKLQLEQFTGSHGTEEVFAWCKQLTSPLTNRFILLPRPKAFARWLLDSPASNIWEIPRHKLLLAADGKAPPDLYDNIHPLVGPNASVGSSVNLIASNAVVYSRTQHVFGGPLYLATAPASYSGYISPSALSSIFKCDAQPIVHKRSELHLTILPNITNVRSFLLDVPHPDIDPSYPLSSFQSHLSSLAANHSKLFPLDGLLWRLIKGSAKPTWTPDFDTAFKSLRLSRPAIPDDHASLGSNTTVCHLHFTLLVDLKDNDSPRSSLSVTALNVPHSLLGLFNLTIPHTYPLRLDDGNVVPWFLVIVLFSDGLIKRGTNRPVMLQTAHAESQPWWEVTLDEVVNPHVIKTRDYLVKDIMGVSVALPKGSYKSTFIDAVSSFLPDALNAFPQATVTDSDDLGETLSPSFETQIMALWENLDPSLLAEAVTSILGTSPRPVAFPPEVFATFSELYRSTMLPAQRERSFTIARRGRSLVYCHSPYEIISANVPIQVHPCRIAIDSMMNLLARPKRVGGVTGQLILDHCYRLLGATLEPLYVGRIYKNLFGPWLEYALSPSPTVPVALSTEVSAHALRDAGWTIEGDDPLTIDILICRASATSPHVSKCPIRTASRASTVCHDLTTLYINLAPPLPSRSVPDAFLLPVTSISAWRYPSRVILAGESISLKGPVFWDALVTPAMD
ncbi:VP4 [Fall chinook aquareovirus]|uniref:VP4 n=1 Tax=Fall chinook aquareovirus TaxID=1963254 RepID=UPI0009950BD0|nr:VP4 [Fall chinook aquareovirus]AQU42728.1 VP4 [Fall chinook aquareovirus]